MIFDVKARDLLFVSWHVPPSDVASMLPKGLEPELADGHALVTLAIARAVQGRLGRMPVPRFAKLTVHTYAIGGEGPGLCFLDARVSKSTFGRRLVGIPFRTTRIRARHGLAEAPTLRASLRYRPSGPANPPELESGLIGSHEVAYFEKVALFRIVARHDPIDWQDASIVGRPQFEPVRSLGFELAAPSSVLYAERVSFRAELPPARVEPR